MRLALAQINPVVGDLEGNRKLILEWLAEARANVADLVVFLDETQDAADNRNFARTKLPMPLLVIEGEKGMNGVLAIQAALISDHLKAIKFPSGHWLMEEKPAETSAALKDFFGN